MVTHVQCEVYIWYQDVWDKQFGEMYCENIAIENVYWPTISDNNDAILSRFIQGIYSAIIISNENIIIGDFSIDLLRTDERILT